MEKTDELRTLIDAFKGYRDLLTPIQSGLADFLATYDALRADVEKLNASFDGEAQKNLKSISDTLAAQAEKSTDLSSRIDQFVRSTNRYVSQIGEMTALFEKTEQKLSTINDIENQASAQLKKLDAVIEEKKINYNLRDLQRSLEGYDNNVRKVSDFINKDVADVLSANAKKIENIQQGNEKLLQDLTVEKESVQELIEQTRLNNELLQKLSDQNDVNEEYIFAVIDKWAASRKVKMKK